MPKGVVRSWRLAAATSQLAATSSQLAAASGRLVESLRKAESVFRKLLIQSGLENPHFPKIFLFSTNKRPKTLLEEFTKGLVES